MFQTLRDTSKLFDTPNFANGFLNVLKQAWKQWEISQNYIDITARDIETSTAMIEALTANTPAPTAVIENRIEAPTAAPTEAAIEDWTGVIEDPTAAPTEAEIDDSTGLIEDPTEPCIIDDTITHAILQFGLVQNFATARIFLTDLTKKFSDFRVAHKGSSFLVLYAADKSTNVVLKICLSGDRAQKEGDIFAQKKEDQSNLFANAIWYDFENDNFIGPISVFAVEKMNYHILDLFSDLAKEQAENDQSDVSLGKIITLLYRVLNFFNQIYQNKSANSFVFDPKKLMLRVLSAEESKKNAINFNDQQCVLVVVCAFDEEPNEVPVTNRPVLRSKRSKIVTDGMTAMKKSLQLVFAVFVEILKGQVSKSEANTFKPAQNDCAISLLF